MGNEGTNDGGHSEMTPPVPPPPSSGSATFEPSGTITSTVVDQPPPPTDSRPTPRIVPTPTPLPARWAIGLLIVALVGQAALSAGLGGNVGTTALILALAGALAASGRLRTSASRVLLAGAGTLALFLPLRSDLSLQALNITVILITLVASAAMAREGSLFNLSLRFAAWQPFRALVSGMELIFVELPSQLTARRVHGTARNQAAAGVLRGVLLVAPVLLLFGALLASADVIFNSFFDTLFGSLGNVWLRLFLAAMSAGFLGALLHLTNAEQLNIADEASGPRLGAIEATVFVSAINVLFAGFVAAQVWSLTDAGSRIIEDAGLTFKEYARQGFFQLLWVAGITLALVLAVEFTTRHTQVAARSRQALLVLTVLLTSSIAGVAFFRLRLYIVDDGLTPLRYYTSAFCLWIAVVFLIVLGRVVGVRRGQDYVLGAITMSGLLALIVVNLSNPGARIADNNVGRDRSVVLLHMEKLESDGLVVLAERLDEFSPELRVDVQAQLCRRPVEADQGWLLWSRPDQAWASAHETIC